MNRAFALLALLILVTACSPGGGGGSSDPSGGGTGGSSDDETAADEPIFVISNAGGFVPVQFLATQTSSFVLLGDGRVIVQGAQTLEFPGPILPPLVERTLTPEGIQEVIDAIRGTGLFDADLDLRGAANMVADASDTIFTLGSGGDQVTVSVYGLGTLTGMEGMERPPGVSDDELEAHRVLQELYDGMLMLETWLPEDAWADTGWRGYEPDAFRLYVRDVTGEPRDAIGVQPQFLEWPTDLSGDPDAFGEVETTFGDGTRCGVVEGEEAVAWLEHLSGANQLTIWTTDDDRELSVMARPLLPHEEPTCPELRGA